MKKKIVAGLLAALCMTSITACGGNDSKTIDGNVNTTVTDNKEAEDTTVDAVEVSDEEEAVSVKGYAFEYDGIIMEVDADAAQYTDVLGEPDSYFEAASCAFQGLDKMYTYASFELDTYPADDKDLVSGIIFKDDSITTMEGIRIGNTLEDVIAAYGDGYTEDAGSVIYSKDDMKLVFIMQDGAVASIEYDSTVLD